MATPARRAARPWLLGSVLLWGLGEWWIIRHPVAMTHLLWVQLFWSLCGGIACAGVLRMAWQHGPFISRNTTRQTVPSWRTTIPTLLGCAILGYALTLTAVALISAIMRALQISTRVVLSPWTLIWALPGSVMGLFIGWCWRRRFGRITGAVILNYVLGLNLATVAVATLTTLLLWGYAVAFPESIRLFPQYTTAAMTQLMVMLAPILLYGYYIGIAPQRSGLLLRTLACCGIFLLNFLQLAIATGDPALVYRSSALHQEAASEVSQRQAALVNWQRYLTIYPRTEERAEALWHMGWIQASLGHELAAVALYRQLASLPIDVPGQRRARQARAILHDRATAGPAPLALVEPCAPVVESADYLNADWRSFLSLVGSGQPTPQGSRHLLTQLRTVSLSQQRIILPSLTSLFEVQAYAQALGVPVTLESVSLDDVKRSLQAGRPVLAQFGEAWWCVVGYEPAWGTFLYYDYDNEPAWIQRHDRRTQAKVIFSDTEEKSTRRLAWLRGGLLARATGFEIDQALADHHGLVARLGPAGQPTATPIARRAFLLGELAFHAGDPILALDYYATALADDPNAAWILPYVQVTRLTIEAPERDIVEARLPLQHHDLMEAFANWKHPARAHAVLARAEPSLNLDNLPAFSTSVVERLADTLEMQDPAQQPTIRRAYELLHDRYPDHPGYLAKLTEVCRRSGALEQLAAMEREWSALEPHNEVHRLRWAETLLELQRPALAHEVLETIEDRSGSNAARYWGLSGRVERALGRPHQAVHDLRRALDSSLANPELRAELALALEALGQTAQAQAEWRWVELTAIDPVHRALARQQLSYPRGDP